MWMPESVGMEFVPSSGVALRVPDVAAARAELEAAGVEFRGETRDTGVCHMAFCSDYDGNTVILHRRYAEPRIHGTSHRESRELHEAAS